MCIHDPKGHRFCRAKFFAGPVFSLTNMNRHKSLVAIRPAKNGGWD